MADRTTIDVYNARAADYASSFDSDRPDEALAGFIAALPRPARVLDLGCGTGDASAHMIAAGIAVDAIDASREMVATARARGVTVRHATFDDPIPAHLYDGVLASFSLLHLRRADLPGMIGRIHSALTDSGLFQIGMKTGTGEERDPLGRHYTYVGADELSGWLESAGFTVTWRTEGTSAGLSGIAAPWIILRAHA